MSDYDKILRGKENEDNFNEGSMEKHWSQLEQKMKNASQLPKSKTKIYFLRALAVAALLAVALWFYISEKSRVQRKTIETLAIRSAIKPLLKNTNVPYESFNFDASTGDTLFTLNGSVIIFPRNAVLDKNGKPVTGNIEVRTREFNDVFDYSIAGIPMDYDSAGTNYKFISSAMIDISAYQNGDLLQVNPNAKPELNLVSTNKELHTNLYKLDTITGKWMNRGKEDVNAIDLKNTVAYAGPNAAPEEDYTQTEPDTTVMVEIPAPPQKASNKNPVIDVTIDPASFKELLVYDGLKFEVTDADAAKVGEDSKTEWDNIELVRGKINGTYKVIFSKGSKTAIYNVRPVLDEKDFAAAEKIYKENLKAYTSIKKERKAGEKRTENKNKRIIKENNKIDELNRLMTIRNTYVEAENLKIDALNNKIKKRENARRIPGLQQNLIRSFQIDGFGYWNCDQPSTFPSEQYVGIFKDLKNEPVAYRTFNIAVPGINRLENYYNNTATIQLIPAKAYFGWLVNDTGIYYFTLKDFQNAVKTNNPNSITISMTRYNGQSEDYGELKAAVYNVNIKNDVAMR